VWVTSPQPALSQRRSRVIQYKCGYKKEEIQAQGKLGGKNQEEARVEVNTKCMR
jgi:hypothetical protein